MHEAARLLPVRPHWQAVKDIICIHHMFSMNLGHQ